MNPVRIAVNGASGRMGQAIAELAADRDDIVLVAGLAAESVGDDDAAASGYPWIGDASRAAEAIGAADVLVDFSAPEALRALLDEHGDALAGKALVVGTTGLDDATLALLDNAATRAAVLIASNFSVGVNLLLGLVEQAARVLPAPEYDVEIVETHHRRKVDAPSGTALSLADEVARARGVELASVRRDGRSGRPGERPNGEIGLHAVRGGGIVGEHRVLFLGALERIEIAHAAAGRVLFADGALRAARWIAGRGAGRYTMKQVLGLQETGGGE